MTQVRVLRAPRRLRGWTAQRLDISIASCRPILRSARLLRATHRLHRLQKSLRLSRDRADLRAGGGTRHRDRLASVHARHPQLPRLREAQPRRQSRRRAALCRPVAAGEICLSRCATLRLDARHHRARHRQDLGYLAGRHRNAMGEGARSGGAARIHRHHLRALLEARTGCRGSRASSRACSRKRARRTIGFRDYVSGEGRALHDTIQHAAFDAGIFGVPTYIIDRRDIFRARASSAHPLDADRASWCAARYRVPGYIRRTRARKIDAAVRDRFQESLRLSRDRSDLRARG